MKLLDIIKINSEILNSKLESSKLFEHNGLRGTCREEDLISIIRDCLPECYGMKSGQIFSTIDDKISKQIDVVIYDSVFSNYFKRESSSSLFPCESVYGSIEVKSYLNEETFKQAIENIKSVRELNRREANCLDITPIRHLDLSPETFRFSTEKTNEYLNIIFCYDSVSEETITNYIKELNYDLELLPTIIYIHKKGIIYSKVQVDSDREKTFLGMNHSINNNYCLSKFEKNSLTAFFILINAMLEQIQLKSIDYTSLSNQCLSLLKKADDILLF